MTQPKFTSLAQAVEAYYEELRLFIRQKTGSLVMAEDIVQETWIRASTTGAAMPNNPRAYLYRMASNIAIDQIRAQKSRGRVEQGGATDWEGDQHRNLEQIPADIPAPDEAALAHQQFDILMQAIAELPEKCRQVFLLYRGQGLTMRQIAQRLGTSEKTVEKHIARAMLHCRIRLREAGRDI